MEKESPIPPDTKLDPHKLTWNRFPIRSEIHVNGEEGIWEVQSVFQNDENQLVITAHPKVHPDHPGVPKTFLASDCNPVAHD